MYEYSDLFDMRSNVGPRLEALMKELEYTKAVENYEWAVKGLIVTN